MTNTSIGSGHERRYRVSHQDCNTGSPMRELAKGETKELSEKAKLRLKILEYYYRDSARFSAKGRPEVSLTCRHFGIRPVINDNGSQNMRDAEAFLRSETITQYWTRPREPKEKPFVERLIGTLQKACLDYHYEPMNVRELSGVVDSWLDKYHVYRPYESLGFLTPAEFSATLGVSIPHVARVS